MPKEKVCTACGEIYVNGGGRGLCPRDYMRWSRTGTTEAREWVRGGKPCSVDPSHGRAHAKGLCASCAAIAYRASAPKCKIETCKYNSDTAGYCMTHYKRWVAGQDLSVPIRAWLRQNSVCMVEACNNKAAPDSYCKTHSREDYGRGWAKARDAIRKRDNYACQNCGSLPPEEAERNWPVAHLIPIKAFPKDLWFDLAHAECNLVVLCIGCHVSFDRNAETAWGYETGERFGRKSWPAFCAMPADVRAEYSEKLERLTLGREDVANFRDALILQAQGMPVQDA